MTAFKNDIEYSQLVLHTAAVLQSNKFMQVCNPTKPVNQVKGVLRKWNLGCMCLFCFQPLLTRKNELDKLRKEVKEQWQREQKKMVS